VLVAASNQRGPGKDGTMTSLVVASLGGDFGVVVSAIFFSKFLPSLYAASLCVFFLHKGKNDGN
jgi:hypothetical protein